MRGALAGVNQPGRQAGGFSAGMDGNQTDTALLLLLIEESNAAADIAWMLSTGEAVRAAATAAGGIRAVLCHPVCFARLLSRWTPQARAKSPLEPADGPRMSSATLDCSCAPSPRQRPATLSRTAHLASQHTLS